MRADAIVRRIVVCVCILSMAGCSRVAGLRHRWFGGDTTSVPLTEQSATRQRGAGTESSGRPRAVLAPLANRTAWAEIGRSVEGRSIEAIQFGSGPLRVLFIGGIHGDEPEGLEMTERFAAELLRDRSAGLDVTFLAIRDLNPDGTANRTRTNANGVDLNRNFPASNWDATARQARMHPGPRAASEPETQLLVAVIREFQPDRILVMHATRGKPMNNYDGPARELAESMSQFNGYDPEASIGYPTPGSLGSYAGIDLNVPIITLELPRGVSSDEAWQANSRALRVMVR